AGYPGLRHCTNQDKTGTAPGYNGNNGSKNHRGIEPFKNLKQQQTLFLNYSHKAQTIYMLPTINPTKTKAWKQLQQHAEKVKQWNMRQLFSEDPNRAGSFSLQH